MAKGNILFIVSMALFLIISLTIVNVGAVSSTTNTTFNVNGTETDTTPPATITNLDAEVGDDWINWTWTNPSDDDFSHCRIYIDDVYVGNTSDEFYYLDDLDEGTYLITIHTQDTNGNINNTDVSDTQEIKDEEDEEDDKGGKSTFKKRKITIEELPGSTIKDLGTLIILKPASQVQISETVEKDSFNILEIILMILILLIILILILLIILSIKRYS
jgi:hypothetical protein